MSKKKNSKKNKKVVIKKKAKTSFWKSKEVVQPLMIVLGVTAVVFFPSIFNDFVNWDDDVNLIDNEYMNGFTWDNIKGIWTTTVIGNYNPLSIFSLAMENALFGMESAFIYHLNNLLLHLVCTYLVYRVFLLMNLKPIPAALGALLFGIHPMRVESVAWVTERKDVLYGAFFLYSMVLYLKYLKGGLKTKKQFWSSLFWFVPALLSKIQAVTLPLSMLSIDYYFKRPLKVKLILEKIPFFLLSLAAGLIGIYFLGENNSLDDRTNYSFLQRLVVGGYSLIIYLVKFILPYKMVPVYPYEAILDWKYYASLIPVLGFFGWLFYAFKKENRALVFGLTFFFFNVMFMLQVLSAGQGFIADRFTYIPYIGLFFIVAYYYQKWSAKPSLKTGLNVGVGLYLLMCGIMTFNQIKIWKNGETLWTHVEENSTNTPLPFGNRANFRRENKQFDLAMTDYNRAIEIAPNDGSYYNSRGKCLFDMGRVQDAIPDYTKSLELDDTKAEVFINRGSAYGMTGQFNLALPDISKGIEMEPNEVDGYLARTLLYMKTGNFADAAKDYDFILARVQNDHNLYYESAVANKEIKQFDKALQQMNRAIQMSPNEGLYYGQRYLIHTGMGNTAAANSDAQAAKQRGVDVNKIDK